jgi:hypothetical protein
MGCITLTLTILDALRIKVLSAPRSYIYVTLHLDWKENNGIRTTGFEDSQGNIILDQKQILKIWEIYVAELYDRANRPENLNVEPEEEVSADHKGPHILRSEVEKAIKEMRNKKDTGDDDVPVEVLKLLGENGLNLMTQLSITYMKVENGPRISLKLQWLH